MPLRAIDPRLGQRLLEAAPVLALLLDADGRVRYINSFGERLTGWSLDEIAGQDWFERALPDDARAETRARFDRAIAGGRINGAANAIVTRSGERRVVDWRSTRIDDEHGAPLLLALGRDVSEQVAAEAALRASESRWRQLFDDSPQPMWVYDVATLRFLAVNEAAVRHYGWSREQFLAMTLRDIRPPADVAAMEADVGQRRGAYAPARRWRHLRADGAAIDVDISANETRFEGRNARLVLVHDVTERVRAERALAAHQADLERLVQLRTADLEVARDDAVAANLAKSNFLSRMSHELRTPMNAILGFAQLLQLDAAVGEPQMDRVHEIVRAGRHLLTLINDVLDLAKIEAGTFSLSPEPLVLADLVAECMRMTAPLAAARGLVWQVAPMQGCTLRADRTRLRQVLLNLLSNAVKYNRDGGRIVVDAAPAAGGRVRLTVRDDGAGIAADRRGELFQPFQRLGAEQAQIEGTGMGLAIARQLVQLMGGEIDVEAAAGGGSAFWLELPRADLAPAPPPRPDAAADAPVPASLVVLYVEDNPANLKLVQQIVDRHAGVLLVPAANARVGLQAARVHAPDLILLDIHLPDADGYELLKRFRAEPATQDTPVVAVTAHAMRDDETRVRAAGFSDYIAKPIDVAVLDALLERMGQARTG